MSPLRLFLYVIGGFVAGRVADAIADALEAAPEASGQAARKVELEERRQVLESELQGVRIVRELPADAGAAVESPALPFGPPREPAKA